MFNLLSIELLFQEPLIDALEILHARTMLCASAELTITGVSVLENTLALTVMNYLKPPLLQRLQVDHQMLQV